MERSISGFPPDPSSEIPCVHKGMCHETPVARRQVEITNRLGFHLRAAEQFVRVALRFQCEIRVQHQGSECDGKSILEKI